MGGGGYKVGDSGDRQLARLALRACVRMHAGGRAGSLSLIVLANRLSHNDREDSEMCARISVEKSAAEV